MDYRTFNYVWNECYRIILCVSMAPTANIRHKISQVRDLMGRGLSWRLRWGLPLPSLGRNGDFGAKIRLFYDHFSPNSRNYDPSRGSATPLATLLFMTFADLLLTFADLFLTFFWPFSDLFLTFFWPLLAFCWPLLTGYVELNLYENVFKCRLWLK